MVFPKENKLVIVLKEPLLTTHSVSTLTILVSFLIHATLYKKSGHK